MMLCSRIRLYRYCCRLKFLFWKVEIHGIRHGLEKS